VPVAPALALAAWAGLDAALHGTPAASAGLVLLLLAVVAVLLVCRRLRAEDREVLFTGVTGIGLVVALVYPGISLLALAIVLGVWLLVLGIMEIFLAFRARSVGRAASRIAAATSP
jgi:Short repeat of unknown function (DUF308)